ncbi:hypothetical protein SCUCBS95973_006163 [Sporothrix curviconia]|uniref:Peptidase S8/S53 domain-containing protein n=1 Tax=Sporothrix curviconia TaxID=1260050 RepID=A0ABP0C2W9_9PEZI
MPRKTGAVTSQRHTAVTNETSITEVLKEALTTNFKDATAAKGFQERHRERLNKDPSIRYRKDEVLSKLAQQDELGGHRDFVRWAVQNHRKLLFCKTEDGYTPLHLAIRDSNNEFVGLVLQYTKNIQELLAEKTVLEMTCLHLAIDNRSPFTGHIIERLLQNPTPNGDGTVATPGGSNMSSGAYGVFTAKAKDVHNGYDGMTPLHMAVTAADTDDRDNFMGQVVAPPMSNAKPQAVPSKAPRQADGDGRGQDATRDIDGGRGRETVTRGQDRGLDRGLERGLERGQDRLPINTRLQRVGTANLDKEPATPIQKAPETTVKEKETAKNDTDLLRNARRFEILDIVKRLVDACPRVLVDCKDASSCTPFQAALDLEFDEKKDELAALKTDAQREDKRHEIIDNLPVLNYLRKYIIDNFNRRDAMRALYKVGDERVLEFDLSGLPYSTINADFLQGLGKVLKFEGLLKYVALPRLTIQDEDGELSNMSNGIVKGEDGQAAKSSYNTSVGLQNMCTVFNWLKKHNVKSVIKVSVVDDVEPSHSDEAIELCLGPVRGPDGKKKTEGLDVRIWNWFKIDLCIDVIYASAPNVRDVTLYSSGNNAVLVGWSSSAGLPRLKELKRVHIYIREGLEKKTRLHSYISRFQAELTRQIPGINCTWESHKADSSYNSVFVERGGEKETESKWMRTMKDYAHFLQSVKPDHKVNPVKIAIIDDGIDTSLGDFTDKIQVGESFFQLSELFGRRGSYYVPTGKHGTLMAQSICSICPMVKLYIAQLEVLPGQNGQRSFTAESATEAVLWAINQGVDIISMSWSINGRDILSKLEDALREADRQKIVMFCASIDEGPSTADTTYPGKAGNCIKIGASTGTGAKLSWVSDSNSQFLLPGEVPTHKSADTNRTPYMGSFGSSVSTALAAGLAGVLIYTDRLLDSENMSTGSSDVRSPSEGVSPGIGSAEMANGLSTGVVVSAGGATGTGAAVGAGGARHVDYLRLTRKMQEAFEVLSKGTEHNKFPQVWDHIPKDIQSLVWNSKAHPEATERTKAELGAFMKLVRR